MDTDRAQGEMESAAECEPELDEREAEEHGRLVEQYMSRLLASTRPDSDVPDEKATEMSAPLSRWRPIQTTEPLPSEAETPLPSEAETASPSTSHPKRATGAVESRQMISQMREVANANTQTSLTSHRSTRNRAIVYRMTGSFVLLGMSFVLIELGAAGRMACYVLGLTVWLLAAMVGLTALFVEKPD